MDSDALLERLRHLVTSHNSGAYRDTEAVENLAELVQVVGDLDTWLSRGGFLPFAWSRQ